MIPTTSAVTANTIALAASSRRRRGTALRVARIMPVPYSLVMTSTPSTPNAICDRCRPARLSRVTSTVAFSGALSAPGRKMAPSAASATLDTTATSRLQKVERTEPSLQNSDRRMSAKPDSGREEVGGVAIAAMAGLNWHGGRGGRALGRVVVAGVAGELHVSLLQRRLLRRELLQGQSVRPGELADG